MQILYVFLFIVISYLLGSIPNGYIVGKIFKQIDIRQHGSKNMGATNIARVMGKKYAVFVFILDALKGAFVIVLVRILMAYSLSFGLNLGKVIINDELFIYIYPLYGIFAVLGHVYPIFLKFKGGKAVATGVGAVIAMTPFIGLIGLAVFLIIFAIFRYASLASLYGTVTVFILILFHDIFLSKEFFVIAYDYHPNNWLIYILEYSSVLIISIIIFLRHRPNLEKLAEGKENKFERN